METTQKKPDELIQTLLSENLDMKKEIEILKNKLEHYEQETSGLSPAMRQALSQYVEDSALSTRIKHICMYNNIRTIADLAKLGKWDFMRLSNAGPVTVSEVTKFLTSQGLTWNMKI